VGSWRVDGKAALGHLVSMNAQVTQLWVYPIKGAAGIAVESAELDTFGLHLDRRWMLVDAAGVFLSQREISRLALVRTALDGASLVVSADGRDLLEVSAAAGARRLVQVWNDQVEARDVGPEAARWFSDMLGVECSLVHMDDETIRPVDPRFANGSERVSFADAFPLLLISEGSLRGLNEKLAEPVLMNRFRPNVVVDGPAVGPHAEDAWTSIRVGTIPMDVVKPCSRCTVPMVDQATGVRGKEPIRTLNSYRNVGGKVMFGQNVIHRGVGRVAVGDAVEINGVRLL
jgi:uncharacterized protein